MKRLYKGGQVSPLLHDIDAQGWLALGWSEQKPGETLAEQPTPVSPALELINNAIEASDIAVLPSIGAAIGGRILESRPEDGYAALSAVEALDFPRVDWEAVQQWSPE